MKKDAFAASYYVSTNGSDTSDGSINFPWATFDFAMINLQPGDTLIIKDGVYFHTLSVTITGTPTSHIIIKAEHDGAVIIDGENASGVCRVTNSIYVEIEGIVCQNSDESVLKIFGSNNINVKRVSAYNAGVGNYHVFSIYNSYNVVLEDTAASGSGRYMYDVFSSNNITVRRCWGRWQSHAGGGGDNGIIQVYGSSDTIIENCIGTQDPEAVGEVQGMGVWRNVGSSHTDRNKFYGNVTYDLTDWGYTVSSAKHVIEDNEFHHNVGIDNKYGFFQRADDNLFINHFIVTGSAYAVACQEQSSYTKDPGWAVNGTLKNSVLLNSYYGLFVDLLRCDSFSNQYNNYFNLNTNYGGDATQGSGEIFVDAQYNTSTYGKGAYVMQPSVLQGLGEGGADMGAEVLYRYENGVLTSTPLWPWPMEARIFGETGTSVTWEGCGGIWKTLNGVYSGGDPTLPSYADGPVRIAGAYSTYYYSLQDAYSNARNGDTIQVKSLILTEDIIANQDISATLEGGYSCDYSSAIGKTKIRGNHTVSNGTLTIENIVLD